MISVNGVLWQIKPVEPNSGHLRTSRNTITLGVTDDRDKTVYLNNRLRGHMLTKVVSHEMVHVFIFSHNIYIPLETEELIADFLATYGRDILAVADDVISRFVMAA